MLISISSLLSAFLRFDGDMDMDEEYVQQRFRYHKEWIRKMTRRISVAMYLYVPVARILTEDLPSSVSCTTSMEC
jgi:hypothetical protein